MSPRATSCVRGPTWCASPNGEHMLSVCRLDSKVRCRQRRMRIHNIYNILFQHFRHGWVHFGLHHSIGSAQTYWRVYDNATASQVGGPAGRRADLAADRHGQMAANPGGASQCQTAALRPGILHTSPAHRPRQQDGGQPCFLCIALCTVLPDTQDAGLPCRSSAGYHQ